MKIFFLLSIFLIINTNAYAQDDSILFYTDEDLKPFLQFSKANDQNYTMGLGFGFASPKLNGSYIFRPVDLIDRIFIPEKFRSNDSLLPASITLNGTAFTPDELRESNVITEDRPYAFLLYVSTKKLYLKDKSSFSTEFIFGILGLNLGKWVQTGIHKLMNDNNTHEPYIPRGWHNQISNGGEPTFLYTINYERLALQSAYFEFKYGGQGMVGYYTCANIQASVRFGLLDSQKWTQNYSPLGSGNKIFKNMEDEKKFEFFLFGSIKPTVFVYNEMLNGGFRHSSHTLSWNQVNHFVVEWNTGVGLSIPTYNKTNSLDLFWTVNAGRTSEINTALSRAHEWGGIYVTYTY